MIRVTIYFMAPDLWNCTLDLRAHTFYPERDEFVSTNTRFREWVCIAVESGRFEYEIEVSDSRSDVQVERGEAEFGDLIFARPDGLFNRHVIVPPLVYHVLQWSFSAEGQGEAGDRDFWRAGKWPVRDRGRLASTLTALRPLLGRGDDWSARRRQHLLEELLHLAWTTRQEPAILDPLMSHAAGLLRHRASETFGMSEISGAIGLGPVQFTRRFHAAFGKNPIEYLTEVRLENAQKMLIETPATLDEIAARCGWASGAYLSFVFERHYQLTPGRFRKRHRV